MIMRDPPHYIISLNALLAATAGSSISNAQHLKCFVALEARHPAWAFELSPFHAGVNSLQEGRVLRYLDTRENYCLIDRSAMKLVTYGKMDYLPIRNLLKAFNWYNGDWYNGEGARVARIVRASPTMPTSRPL